MPEPLEITDIRIGCIKPILYVGAWVLIDGDAHAIRVSTTRKPRLIHRLFMRLLLGWKWVPNA